MGNVIFDEQRKSQIDIEVIKQAEKLGCVFSDDYKTLTRIENNTITRFSIPKGVTSIGKYAFTECSSLANINLPNNVTPIGELAFSMCYELPFDISTIAGLILLDGWVIGCTEDCPSMLNLIGICGICDCTFEDCVF